MEEDVLNVFRSDLDAQLDELERSYARIDARSEGFATNTERCESLAYQLHNLSGD